MTFAEIERWAQFIVDAVLLFGGSSATAHKVAAKFSEDAQAALAEQENK